MSLEIAVELMETIRNYMVGEDGHLRIQDNDLGDAMAECALRYLADEAEKDADLAKAFYALVLDIDQIDPSLEDPNG